MSTIRHTLYVIFLCFSLPPYPPVWVYNFFQGSFSSPFFMLPLSRTQASLRSHLVLQQHRGLEHKKATICSPRRPWDLQGPRTSLSHDKNPDSASMLPMKL